MFGDKQSRRARLERMADVIEQYPQGISQNKLARQMGIPRSTVKRDLPTLEQAGILLAEDERGRLSMFKRKR